MISEQPISQAPKSLLLPVNYLVHALDLVESKGGDRTLVHKRSGVTPAILSDPKSTVDFERFNTFVLSASTESGLPGFGLFLGSRFTLMTHGNLGQGILSSENIGAALRFTTRYFETRTPLISIQLNQQVNGIKIKLEERYLLGPIRIILLEIVVSALVGVFDYISDRALTLKKAQFAYCAPRHSSIYSAMLNSSMEFDAKKTCLYYAPIDFETPLALADKNAKLTAEEKCRRELANLTTVRSFELRIERILLRFRGEFPDFNFVANELAITPRTLRRRLSKESTNFSTVLDGVKYKLARQYLDTSSLTIQQIGFLLGYMDPSNFGRAFRKWNGMSPRQYRAKKSMSSVG